MGIKDRREREKQKRRETILKSAIEIMKEKSFSEISMEKIAEKTELSKGTLYLYFPDKETLFVEALEKLVDEFLEKLITIKQQCKFTNVRQALETIISASIEFYTNNEQLHRFLYNYLPSMPKEGMRKLYEMLERISDKIKRLAENFYEQFPDEYFRYSFTDRYIAMRGLIWSYLEECFRSNGRNKPDAKVICDIFLRGVLK